MAEWRGALRDLMLPTEVVLLVVAVLTLAFVVFGRRGASWSLPSLHAWLLGVVLLVSGIVALVSRLWISALALALMLITLTIAAIPEASRLE